MVRWAYWKTLGKAQKQICWDRILDTLRQILNILELNQTIALQVNRSSKSVNKSGLTEAHPDIRILSSAIVFRHLSSLISWNIYMKSTCSTEKTCNGFWLNKLIIMITLASFDDFRCSCLSAFLSATFGRWVHFPPRQRITNSDLPHSQ